METKYTATELFDAFNRAFVATVNDRTYTLPGHAMPIASIIRAFEYGFQRIVNDKCGGADKTDEEKDRIASLQVGRLATGEIAERATRGTGVDEFTEYARRTMLGLLAKPKRKELAAMPDKGIAWLDERIARNMDKPVAGFETFRAMVESAIADAAREREEKAKLVAAASALDLD